MEFTGERFVPGCGIEIAFEHYHRYLFVKELVKGKRVLDLACGEGYGSALMSRWAQHVTGVDVDEEAVAHARAKYAYPSLEFLAGDIANLRGVIEDGSTDVVVFYEAIEHVARHEQLLALNEVKRVLDRHGVLIISSPNKQLLEVAGNPKNEYHKQEMTGMEFKELLSRFFTGIDVYGQRFETGGIIWPASLQAGRFPTSWNLMRNDEDSFSQVAPPADSALFFIAVCSDSPLQLVPGGSILLDEKLNIQINATAAAVSRISVLEDRVRVLEGRISDILESNSWKITAPLRWLKRITGGIENR